MKFKVSLISYPGNLNEENIIANNKNETKRNLQIFNPNLTVLNAIWGYK